MSIASIVLVASAILVVGFLGGLLVGGLGTTLNGIAFLSLPVLIVGFLIGWLLEWIIDNQYRRMREMEQAKSTNEPTPAQRVSTGNEIAELTETLKAILAEREQQLDELRADLKTQRLAYDQLQEEFNHYAASHPDDLTVINGIGRVFQSKLRDVGYSTYSQLARASAEQVRADLGLKDWQQNDPAEWIAQANVILNKKRQDEANNES
jgi:predicted flap endonuclease-1-like 5' DNA nuclease